MKTLSIYKRTILRKTGYRSHPFKEETQLIVEYDGRVWKNGHHEDRNNERLRTPFERIYFYYSWSLISLRDYQKLLPNRSDADKWLKATLNLVILLAESE